MAGGSAQKVHSGAVLVDYGLEIIVRGGGYGLVRFFEVII